MKLAILILLVATTAHADKGAQKKAAQARVDAASEAYRLLEVQWEAGTATAEQVGEWSERLAEAQRDQGLKGKALAAALSDNVARQQALVDGVATKVSAGIESQADTEIAAYYLAEAQWMAAGGK